MFFSPAKKCCGFVMAVFGVGEVGGALLAGRLVAHMPAKRFRTLCCALTGLSLLAAAPLELGWLTSASGSASSDPRIGLSEPRIVIPLLAATLFGLSDSAVTVLAYAELARSDLGPGTGSSARAGAARILFTSFGLCASFALGPYVPGVIQLVVLTLLLLGAFATLRLAAVPRAPAELQNLAWSDAVPSEANVL